MLGLFLEFHLGRVGVVRLYINVPGTRAGLACEEDKVNCKYQETKMKKKESNGIGPGAGKAYCPRARAG